MCPNFHKGCAILDKLLKLAESQLPYVNREVRAKACRDYVNDTPSGRQQPFLGVQQILDRLAKHFASIKCPPSLCIQSDTKFIFRKKKSKVY